MDRSPSTAAAPSRGRNATQPETQAGSRWSLISIAIGQPVAMIAAVQFLVTDLRRCDEVLYDDARVLLALVPMAALGLCALGNRRGRASHDGAIVNTALTLALYIVLLVATDRGAALLLTPRCAELGVVTWTDIVGPLDLIAIPIGAALVAAIVRARPAVTTRRELGHFAVVAAISIVIASALTYLIAADRDGWGALISCC